MILATLVTSLSNRVYIVCERCIWNKSYLLELQKRNQLENDPRSCEPQKSIYNCVKKPVWQVKLWQTPLLFFLCWFDFLLILFFFLHRAFIPRKDQPLFDILVGMNGEIMHSRKQHVDDSFSPDLLTSSDLESSEYNRHIGHNTGPIGRFG